LVESGVEVVPKLHRRRGVPVEDLLVQPHPKVTAVIVGVLQPRTQLPGPDGESGAEWLASPR
jgi:hypothetical protein